MHWYIHVMTQPMRTTLSFSKDGQRNILLGRLFVEPVLRVVLVDSFVILILVIEDDNTVYKTIPKKGLQGGITVVTPGKSNWPNNFLSSTFSFANARLQNRQ